MINKTGKLYYATYIKLIYLDYKLEGILSVDDNLLFFLSCLFDEKYKELYQLPLYEKIYIELDQPNSSDKIEINYNILNQMSNSKDITKEEIYEKIYKQIIDELSNENEYGLVGNNDIYQLKQQLSYLPKKFIITIKFLVLLSSLYKNINNIDTLPIAYSYLFFRDGKSTKIYDDFIDQEILSMDKFKNIINVFLRYYDDFYFVECQLNDWFPLCDVLHRETIILTKELWVSLDNIDHLILSHEDIIDSFIKILMEQKYVEANENNKTSMLHMYSLLTGNYRLGN